LFAVWIRQVLVKSLQFLFAFCVDHVYVSVDVLDSRGVR